MDWSLMITKQEMFTRSVVGLRSQAFARCLVEDEPVYNDGDGKRCAWGWVDESIGPEKKNNGYYVSGLAEFGIGKVAKTLDLEHQAFAGELQWCHDDSATPTTMERRLRQLGVREKVIWPA